MKEEQKSLVAGLDIRIGVTVAISLLLCNLAALLGLQIQSLAACTAAIMCVQETGKASWKAGLTRLLGVVCGGVLGILVVLIQSKFDNAYLFVVLCGVAVILDIVLCRLIKLPFIAARVSCITFLLVVLVLGGTARINYALGRFLGTLLGAVVSVVITFAWDAVAGAKQKQTSNP